jgi:hypothetical protein
MRHIDLESVHQRPYDENGISKDIKTERSLLTRNGMSLISQSNRFFKKRNSNDTLTQSRSQIIRSRIPIKSIDRVSEEKS